MEKLREKFLLDPTWIYLNHGSFGACPREVFETYQAWELALERQPVDFLARRYHLNLDEARQRLATFLGTSRDGLVFVNNATTGVNIVLHSLILKEGDQILTTDWEYGACVRACQAVGRRGKAELVMAELNGASEQALVDSLMAKVSEKTRLIMVSAITSNNGFLMPIEAIVAAAHARNVLVLVDGAHVPGQQALDLDALNADFYTGNCHKWMMAPKGCAFLYVKPEWQQIIEPLVVSWGWGDRCEHTQANQFVSFLQYSGTQDPSPWLTVSACIDFMEREDWAMVRDGCKALVEKWRKRFDEMLGQGSAYAYDAAVPNQMFCVILPPETDLNALRASLLAEKIEVQLPEMNGQKMIRVSVQGYVTDADIEACYMAVVRFLGKEIIG